MNLVLNPPVTGSTLSDSPGHCCNDGKCDKCEIGPRKLVGCGRVELQPLLTAVFCVQKIHKEDVDEREAAKEGLDEDSQHAEEV